MNNSSANIKLSKTLASKIMQSGIIIGRIPGPLLIPGLPLMKNVPKPLPKRILIPLGLPTAAAEMHVLKRKFLGWEQHY